jgi:hypothetical protein
MKLMQTVAVLALIASPALADTAAHSNVPSAQNSGAGIPGKPGGKSGPAVAPQGRTANSDQTNPATRLQDAGKIPGKPGGKSGPAVMPPSHAAQKP